MHVDGIPFRKLGDQIQLSGKQIFLKVKAAINLLIWNWQLTKLVCEMKCFSSILILDGKYVAVKGFNAKIPFVFGIDYLTHDIVHGDLFVAEDEMAFSQFFQKLYDLGYDLKIVVADDRAGLKQALNKVFPYAKLQLCHNHYLENIRTELRVRTEERYRHFFNSLKFHLFTEGTDEKTIDAGLEHVLRNHAAHSPKLQDIIWEIKRRREILFNYLKVKDCPNNTNLIELYNSHLAGRLKTIKGFQSFESARRWLNAWMIRRRTKTFTDCDKKFKHLNKHASLEFTIKKQAQWPDSLTQLGINRVEYFNLNEKFPEKTD
jgi:transposase-like protein